FTYGDIVQPAGQTGIGSPTVGTRRKVLALPSIEGGTSSRTAMSSQPRPESPGSSSRQRIPGRERPPTASIPGRTTDDTPTIISRQQHLFDKDDLGESIRGRTLAHF